MANKAAKIMAILALSGIIISVIGTGILFFIGSSNSSEKNISKEELQKLVESGKVKISDSGSIEIQK